MAKAMPRRQLMLTATALAVLLGASGLAIVHQVMRSHDRSQAVADNAAFAGLNELVGVDGIIDTSTFDTARSAASRVAQAQGYELASWSAPSAEKNSFSVALSSPGNRHDVVSTAHYVRPGQSVRDAIDSEHVARLSDH
jgi:hypothetical protein